jgi:hypothetical protein
MPYTDRLGNLASTPEKETRNLLAPSTSPYALGTPRGGLNPFSLEGSQLATRWDQSRLLQPPPPPNYDISDYQLGGPLYQPGVVSRDQPFNYFNRSNVGYPQSPSYMPIQGTETGLNPTLNNIARGVAALGGSALSGGGMQGGEFDPTTPKSIPTTPQTIQGAVGDLNRVWDREIYGGATPPQRPTPEDLEMDKDPPQTRVQKLKDLWEKYSENPWVQLGVRLGGGLLADKLVGGPPGVPDAANLLAQQAANAQYGRQIAGQLGPMAQQLLGGATQSYAPVANMWSGLLTGGRGRLTNLLAPDIGEITDAYRGPTQAMANLQPRGGARASLMAQLPYQKARDIATLFQEARPLAAQGLLQTGQAQAATGMAGYENMANLLAGADLAGARLGTYDLARQQERNKQSMGVGKTIMDTIFGNTPAVAGTGNGDAGGSDSTASLVRSILG